MNFTLANRIVKPRLYFAAPLFSDAERKFNEDLAAELRSFFDVYLPQQDGGLLVNMVAEGVDAQVAAKVVFNLDVVEVKKCSVLLIVLDGRTVDEGAAFELGHAYALGKLCVGLQTDPRRMLISGNNPMIDRALEHIFTDLSALLEWAESYNVATQAITSCAVSNR